MVDHNNDALTAAKNILSISTFSRINTKTTNSPFFSPTTEEIATEAILAQPPKDPTQLNSIKFLANIPELLYNIYHLLDSNKREFSYNTFHFFSIDEILNRHNAFINADQKNVCDIACSYYGMGHIIVLSWNKAAQCFMLRRDGGSNDYDRNINYNFIVNFVADNIVEDKKIKTENLFKLLSRHKLEDMRDLFVNNR
ncbi:MAG: hypothetical protein CMF51_04835 [Legionellales bacterium]|nr:hypothetical protein [Legionellales bacterium]